MTVGFVLLRGLTPKKFLRQERDTKGFTVFPDRHAAGAKSTAGVGSLRPESGNNWFGSIGELLVPAMPVPRLNTDRGTGTDQQPPEIGSRGGPAHGVQETNAALSPWMR